MRIAVIGAGNMGCVYGENLARTRVDVVFIEPWQEQVAAIRANGLEMEGLNGHYIAKADATSDRAGGGGGRCGPDLRDHIQIRLKKWADQIDR